MYFFTFIYRGSNPLSEQLATFIFDHGFLCAVRYGHLLQLWKWIASFSWPTKSRCQQGSQNQLYSVPGSVAEPCPTETSVWNSESYAAFRSRRCLLWTWSEVCSSLCVSVLEWKLYAMAEMLEKAFGKILIFENSPWHVLCCLYVLRISSCPWILVCVLLQPNIKGF